MTAAIRFTVVLAIFMASKLRQMAKQTKERWPFGTIGSLPLYFYSSLALANLASLSVSFKILLKALPSYVFKFSASFLESAFFNGFRI